MKSGQLFWGFFLLSIGALFLLTKYDVIYSDFDFIWNLWPLIFILWGAIVIFKNSLVRPVVSAIFGIFLAILLFGLIANIFSGFNFRFNSSYKDYDTQTYSEEYNESIKTAEFVLKSGGGSFEIKDATDKLVEGTSYGSLAEYDLYTNLEGDNAYVEFNLGKKEFDLFHGKLRNHLEVNLNEKPVWDFVFKFGAAKAKFDLSNYIVRNIDLNTGAANVRIKLGDKSDSTNVDVEMGAAKLKLEIPENSGCQLKGDMVLMSRSLSGFEKKDRGYYETPNFENAAKKIFVRINGGVSSISINKY
ncbi:MAG: hypothetical protein GYA14_06245 [Ignavibacteria bacterium]|nr:hypothetical protein [Ignavibacteria bacterium]